MLSTLTTSDTDGDGYIDRLIAAFDENVDDTTIVGGNFSTSSGTVSTVVDDGSSGDAVIWVNLTDGVLLTDAIPTLTIAAGGLEDVPGNANALISNFASTDAAEPAIMSVTADDFDNTDAVFSSGDTITFVFSENTNQPCKFKEGDK